MIRQAALSLHNSLGLSGEDNLVSRTDTDFVVVNVFNSVTSSRVTGNRNFARKCDTEFCSSFLIYHKDSNMFRRFNKVKPCSATLVFGWVTKYEYPVLQ